MILRVYRIRTRHQTRPDCWVWMSHRLTASSPGEAYAEAKAAHANRHRVNTRTVEIVETLDGTPLYPNVI